LCVELLLKIGLLVELDLNLRKTNFNQMDFSSIKFAKNHNEEFYKVLRQRVNEYFKANNITRYANSKMVVKTIFMMALYFVPLVLLLTVAENIWFIMSLWALMGFGMAGLGLSVMHDANHGAYSPNERINKFVGYIIFFIGGDDVNWRIQHNVLHHTYTNVTGMDEDINPGAVMRFSPHEKRRVLHRFQHVYAWFLYGLMTLMWFVSKDYKQAVRYEKMGLTATQKISFRKHMTIVIVSKIIYAFTSIGLPLLLSPALWWQTILGWFMMQFITGLTLAAIFQPAHVVPTSDYPLPDESGNIQADWAVNQLYNTANFAPGAKLFSWYVGGLNYQVEHHLFPNICHIHYSKLSKIVKETALEYNLPYHSYKTFGKALVEHTKMLHRLGNYDDAPALH
jgi:linoleoyl-CoA desaturase